MPATHTPTQAAAMVRAVRPDDYPLIGAARHDRFVLNELDRDFTGWALREISRFPPGAAVDVEELWVRYCRARGQFTTAGRARCTACRGFGVDPRAGRVCRACAGRRNVTVTVTPDPARSPFPRPR